MSSVSTVTPHVVLDYARMLTRHVVLDAELLLIAHKLMRPCLIPHSIVDVAGGPC